MWDWCFDSISQGGILRWIGGIFMMLWPILIILFVFYFFNRNEQDKKMTKDSPMDILKKRYARGDISKEEFEEMKKDLK